jgi:hypothetical protein
MVKPIQKFVYRDMQELINEYKKGKFDPKLYVWKWEKITFSEDETTYSLYANHKKDKSLSMAWDGSTSLGTIKFIGKTFKVQIRELKKK